MTTELLWNQFRAICQIPHPSGHVEALRQYIIGQVQKAGLVADADAAGNIRVELPASAGWEDKARRQGRSLADVTTLQAHIDMVPQADSDVDFDFLADGLRLRETDDLVMADGTTLGADNGIGVAAMLAIVADEALAKTLTHGPLELLFTVDEETGMEGASHLKPHWLKGTQLINLDTEREGDLMVGCAGAVDLNVTYRYKLERGIPEGDRAVRITLGGLKGGHSGMDIHLGRGNACKMMVRFLKHAVVSFEARLAWVQGGGVRNAIPREASAVLTVPEEVVGELLDEAAYYGELFRYELRGVDEGVIFTADVTDPPQWLLPEEVQDDILNSLEAAPDGLFRHSPDLPTVVETSSNLAAIAMTQDGDNGRCDIIALVRSLNEEMKRALSSRLQSCFILGGARVYFSAAYPGWEQPLATPLPQRVLAAYRQLFQTEMHVNSVHCGLECGILHEIYPEMDIVSLGPTIHHPHSPAESVEKVSVERFWQLLEEII